MVTQHTDDQVNRQLCSATRMNPAVYGSLPTDACALSTQGANGPDRIAKSIYDAAGQVLQTLQALGTSVQRTYATNVWGQDGEQLSVTDANGNSTCSVYDGFLRLSQLRFPSTALGAGTCNAADYEGYSYDPGGNRLTLRKRDGVNTIAFTYDALDRQIVKDIPPSGASATDVYTDYDYAGRLIRARFASRTGTGVDYAYDTAGRLTSETTFSRALGYQYDLAGNRTRVTWPDGFYAGYVYDAMNRMTAANENGATSGAGLLATIAYDDLSRRTSLGRGNGASTSYGYDTADRVVSLAHAFVGTSSNQTWTFGYNNASQRISRTSANTLFDWTNHPPATVNKAYDGLNRDAAIAATTGGYDANGNLTFDGTRTFTYDVENRLLTGSAPTAISLSYDPLGRLAQTTAGSAVTKFLYDGDRLSAEYDGSGNLLRRYVHGPGVDEPLVWYEGPGTSDRRQLHQDPQGSIVAWSDGSGNTAASQIQAYGPYGEPQAWAGSRFRYTGQIAIPEAQLYYYKARVYDPATGRFLQTDPVGYKDDLDLYAYVGDDPVDKTDPTGNQEALVLCAAGPAGCAVGAGITVGQAVVAGAVVVGGVIVAAIHHHDSTPTVDEGKQGKHQPDHPNFQPGKGELTHPDPQGLVDDHAGTGQQVGDKPVGEAGSKERVNFGEPIGTHVDGQTGQRQETTNGIIHYDSKGGAHIVPARPTQAPPPRPPKPPSS